jgi:phosphoglycerate dehydrogenase-like enzyme
MSSKQEHFSIAVLDDYQHVALLFADWSVLDARATVTVFNDHLADSDAVVERLQPFDIVCVMRERTPMTRTIIERLPKLRMIASTGPGTPRSISRLQKSGACRSFIRATPRRRRSN